jgi:hypothetical protein
MKATRDHHELGFQRDSGCRRADLARDDGLAGWSCRNMLPLLAPSGRARSPRGAMGLQRLRGSRTNARGWADPTQADHDDDADMRARGSGGIRCGRGTARAGARPGGSDVDIRGPRRADDEFAVSGRTWRRCDGGLP